MQGGIAQTIGLVFAANARRKGISYPGWPSASVYQFCNSVRFVGRVRTGFLGYSKPVEVRDPVAWLDTLPASTTGARLAVRPRNDLNISDRESVGFANGGPIFLALVCGATPEAWYGEWEVTRQNATDRRIWSVTYHNFPMATAGVQEGSKQGVRDSLAKALDDAIEFSKSHNLGFDGVLVSASKALSDTSPLEGFYHSDLIPEGLLSLSDLQLFSSAAKAWVFGGMGSWNDVWFDGDDLAVYRTVSDHLFSAIVDGLTEATNASADT